MSVNMESPNDIHEPPAEPVKQEEETRIGVEVPKISVDLGRGIHFVKLPNFLSVDTRPFDPQTYEDEIDDEEILDDEGNQKLKLKVQNTIRWRERFNEKGAFVKESNARFVRWSDGSLSLHLGDEVFDVEKQSLHDDHNHLFVKEGMGLQGQAVFRSKLTFRPQSTESVTHQRMTKSIVDQNSKVRGIKFIFNPFSAGGMDPIALRRALIKKEEDKHRAATRRENQQRRIREQGAKGILSASYLNDEYSEDGNSISLAAIKNRYKKGGGTSGHTYSSDDGSDLELEQGRKLQKAKQLKDSEDEDGDQSDGGGRETPAAREEDGSGVVAEQAESSIAADGDAEQSTSPTTTIDT